MGARARRPDRRRFATRTGDVAAVMYERVFASALPRLRGQVALRFFRAIYSNFSVGAGTRCWGGFIVTMSKGSSITAGDGLWLVSDVKRAGIALYTPCKLRTMSSGEIVIGDGVGLNGTSITARERVVIGSGTMIAANVIIVDSDFHRHWPPDARRDHVGARGDPVVIGRNVWIGMGSMVLKGATIGDNSIIAAGSVVAGAIPENVMAAGVPAKVIRRLQD